MKLIITRPLDDATSLARKLEERGHEAIIAPLLKIVAHKVVAQPQRNYQATCITSANALRHPELLQSLHKLPLYCVGPQSAQAARQSGFADVRERGGNVEHLAEAMHRELKTGEGPLLYVSGNETSGDLKGKLVACGFGVDRIIAYDAIPLPLQLPESQLAQADGVLLFSARSARLWAKALADLGIGGPGRLVHFCLSQNVAHNLPQDWPVRIAERADEDHMLSLLDRAPEAE